MVPDSEQGPHCAEGRKGSRRGKRGSRGVNKGVRIENGKFLGASNGGNKG